MSATSSIEWTDRTWNPVRGCSVISPGCVNCYAMKFAHRFSAPGKPYAGLTKQTKAGPQWTGQIATVGAALREPLSWRKPARIFVNSMSDLFHEDVSDEFIDRVFAVMALAPQHTFQILTKRADRMRAYMSRLDRDLRLPCTTFPRWRSEAEAILSDRKDYVTTVTHEWPLPNVWLGVSVEDQKHADGRIPQLLATPAAVRFISAEPLIGPVNLHQFICKHANPERINQGFGPWCDNRGDLHWVIVGGESGPGARPFDLAWARSIVQQCQSADVPVFVKQVGARPLAEFAPGCDSLITLRDKKGGDPSEWPDDLRVRQFPGGRA